MSDSEYCKMIEVPVNTCDVFIKPSKRKKRDVVEEVIEKVNKEPVQAVEKQPKRRVFKIKPRAKRVKPQPVYDNDSQSVSVKSSKFDVVSVQVVAVFALIVGIILTNIFWENSGMNNLLKSVFGTDSVKNTAVYTSFTPSAPSKTSEITLTDGVMTFSECSAYSPCDGVVENVINNDGLYTVTISHSDSFSSVISGLEYCYTEIGEAVYESLPLGYSSGEVKVSMFENNAVLTGYLLSGSDIVWVN